MNPVCWSNVCVSCPLVSMCVTGFMKPTCGTLIYHSRSTSNWPCKIKHTFLFFTTVVRFNLCRCRTNNVKKMNRCHSFGLDAWNKPSTAAQTRLFVDVRCKESLSLLFIYLLYRDVINSLNWTDAWLKGTLRFDSTSRKTNDLLHTKNLQKWKKTRFRHFFTQRSQKKGLLVIVPFFHINWFPQPRQKRNRSETGGLLHSRSAFQNQRGGDAAQCVVWRYTSASEILWA